MNGGKVRDCTHHRRGAFKHAPYHWNWYSPRHATAKSHGSTCGSACATARATGPRQSTQVPKTSKMSASITWVMPGRVAKIVLARQGLGVDRIGGLLGVFLYVRLQTFEINRALAHAIRRASAFREREDITLCAFDDQLAIDHPC